MTLLDEQGRLFGRVNVFDAAIVLVAVVVVLGAGAFAFGFVVDDGEPATRYATVDLGTQSPAVATSIAENDTTPGEGITITDAYVGPGGVSEGGNASVVVRARIDGRLVSDDGGPTFEYDGDPLGRDDSLEIPTTEYEVSGEVLRVDDAGATLDTGTLPILLSTNLPASTRGIVEVGDSYRIGDRQAATIEETVLPPVGNETARTDLVGLTVQTINHSGDTYFGATPVRIGEEVGFRTSRYAFTGTVQRWGSTAPPGEPGTTVATVVVRNVDPATADAIEVGLTERRGETTTATITETRREPAQVVLTSDDGNIYERAHPRNETVTLTAELRTRTTDESILFHARPLREGSAVTFDFGSVRARGTVTELDD